MTKQLKHRVIIGVLAILPAIVSGLLANCQAKMEARNNARWQANDKSDALLESVRPSINELVTLAEESKIWADAVTEELTTVRRELAELKNKTAYLQGYVESETRHKYIPPSRDKTAAPLALPAPARKPQSKLPDSIQKAQIFKKAREEMKCAKDDPLCGTEVLDD